MALSQRLELRQGQSLVMTPQLQQAIKLLQLSNMELMEFVEGELERNPLLEHNENDEQAERRSGDAGEKDAPHIFIGDIRDLIQHLTKRGIGVLITDHNVRETLDLVDRAYIIHEGQLLIEGFQIDIAVRVARAAARTGRRPVIANA